MSWQEILLAMLPEHILLGGIVLLVLLEIVSDKSRGAMAVALLAVLAATGAAAWLFATGLTSAPFPGHYAIAPAASAGKAILLALAIPVLLMAPGDVGGPRFHALVLSSLYGAALLLGAGNFAVLFLGLEIASIPVYALAVLGARRPESAEGALKYLVLGGAASALLLMGVGLIFGQTGSLSIDAFATAIGSAEPYARAGVGLVIAALFLKAAIAPFHSWAPDVYEAAAIPITAYMATIVKAAVLFAAIRLFGATELPGPLADLVAVLPLASIVWGNLAAMRQTSFRRMIAYSSIAHAGYMFYAFLDPGPGRFSSIAFYALTYGVLNLLAFAAIPAAEDDAGRDSLDNLKGLMSRRPFAAIMIAIAMISLAGIPPLPGFTAKFIIFQNALAAGYTAWAVAGLVASFLGLYFYFRVIQLMFTAKEGAPLAGEDRPRPFALVATLLCLAATAALAIFPSALLDRLAG